MLAGIGFAALPIYNWIHVGDPLAYWKTQHRGWHQGLDFGRNTIEKLGGVVVHPLHDFNLFMATLAILVIAGGFVLMWQWRPPPEIVVYSAVVIALALLSSELVSTFRFAMTAFPLGIAYCTRHERHDVCRRGRVECRPLHGRRFRRDDIAVYALSGVRFIPTQTLRFLRRMTTMSNNAWGLETRLVHAGAEPDPATGARVTPIYQTTSFVFRDTAHAAALFGLEELGMIYTRIMNPTQDAFEQRMTALEGGVGALATASGQAAQTIALLNLAENGGHIVSSASLYGGTYNQLHYTFPKLGIEVSFIDDPDDLDAWKTAIRPNTKAFYGESIGNPKGDIFDFEGISTIAHDNKIPLVIDNTLASPPRCSRCSTVPMSSCTPRRSSSVVTARRSAA